MKRYEIQVDDLEIESDAIFDTKTKTLYECRSSDMNELCKLLNKEDTKWQKLKEWLEEKKIRNERRIKEAPINTEFYIRVSVQGITINEILTIMQELEGEDE